MSDPMRNYCTYFDSNYLVRGLTLYRSLVRHAEPFALWVLCLDEVSHATISALRLPNVRAVALHELEQADPELQGAKVNRSLIEYYFTLSPVWPLYILDRSPVAESITYLDADLCFYASPEPIFEEMADASVLIIGHRFPDYLRHLEVHGVFNVGLISFRNHPDARACLTRWREQCLDWCYDRVEDGKFADQKYLDEWPANRGVRELQHVGAGLAPWNWMRYTISLNGESVAVDGEPLIFFHFHGLKIVTPWLYQPSEAAYEPMPGKLRRRLYGGYLKELAATSAWIRAVVPGTALGSGSVRQTRLGFRELLARIRRGHMHPRLGSIAL
jgi:hypothetical protein